MKIQEIKCKTALSPSRLPGLDYSLNPYQGCQHKCAYCYVPNVLRIKREDWGEFVNVKTNIPNILSKELRKKRSGVVGISTVTDPYQPIEKKYKLTKYCLEQLLIHDFPICIQTKSDLVTRDIDLISKFTNAEVMMSIATLNDKERKLLEPNSSTVNRRLDVLRKYSDVGIETSVFFGPIYPTIEIEDISNIVDTFIKYGVNKIMIDGFNLKPGVWENIKSVTQDDAGIFEIFSKSIRNKEHYNQLRNEITSLCEIRKIKIVDAF
ncbi:MAG: radical SAM protein [Candidatus Thermoplasmatota archaeon]|nr:radical SAM protein [Candidatus Thermoplasmatota archaeon]